MIDSFNVERFLIHRHLKYTVYNSLGDRHGNVTVRSEPFCDLRLRRRSSPNKKPFLSEILMKMAHTAEYESPGVHKTSYLEMIGSGTRRLICY